MGVLTNVNVLLHSSKMYNETKQHSDTEHTRDTYQVCLCIVLANHFTHITKVNSTSLAKIDKHALH